MKEETKYWQDADSKLMYKQISSTEIILIHVEGRDITKSFHHRHEKVTYPSKERLDQDLAKMKPATLNDWEDIMNEYLQINKEKLRMMNDFRQRAYEEGRLTV